MVQHTMTPADTFHAPLRLTKHQGAGNDFLVLVDIEDHHALGGALVRALCDRRFGVGADGVIRILAGTDGADLTMDLVNADGSTAEMSGNGIRCLAQAAVAAGLVTPPTFTVATLGGVRTVEYSVSPHAGADADPGAGPDWASVDMGPATLGPDRPSVHAGQRSRLVDMGNPHLVLLGEDPTGLDVTELGSTLQSEFPDGINVEFIALGPGPDAITLRVWERGVGETLACGTGSAASAAAARDWGVVGLTVDVHNPGGMLRVTIDDDGPGDGTVVLSGPVAFVADIEVDPVSLLAGRRP